MSRKVWQVGLCTTMLTSLLIVGAPALADDAGPVGAGEVASDTTTTTVTPTEFVDSAPQVEEETAEQFVEQSADMGALVDQDAVSVASAPGVGTVAVVGSDLSSIGSVSRTEADIEDQSGHAVAEEVSYQLRDSASGDGDAATLPIGPGSLGIRFYNAEPCKFLYGAEDGNIVTSCFSLGYLDGGGGREAYGAADDDGSRYWDWFTYHQWGTITPSDAGVFDWNIQSASKKSYLTAASIYNGNPGITDYAPNSSSCDGALSMGAYGFDFSGVLCTDGRDIIFIDERGSFGQKLDINLVAPGNARGLNYRVAIRIKQGVRPDWYTVNRATFRKNFSTTTNTITGVTD